jgi:hypothetical protein
MGRGLSEARHALRAWKRGRSPRTLSTAEDYAGQYSSAIRAAVARQDAVHESRRRADVGPPTAARVAITAGVWIVAVACMSYPWVLWSLM